MSGVGTKPRGRWSRAMWGAAAGVSLLAAAEGRAAVMYVSDPVQHANVIDHLMTGPGMAGMRVTATYANGSTASGVVTVAGGVSVAGKFDLVVAHSGGGTADTGLGSTYWSVINDNAASRLVSVLFDGVGDGAGTGVFDTDVAAQLRPSTPGSESGTELTAYQTDATGAWTADATYSGAVGLGFAAPVGDLYRYMMVGNIVKGGVAGVPAGGEIRFNQDTDMVVGAGAVPEPAFAGLGAIVGLLAMRRRTR